MPRPANEEIRETVKDIAERALQVTVNLSLREIADQFFMRKGWKPSHMTILSVLDELSIPRKRVKPK